MTVEIARQIRIGAERLRKIAAYETHEERAAEMTRIAQEMEEHAVEMEQSIMETPEALDDAAR